MWAFNLWVKLHIIFYRTLWRILLFIILAPISKKYRQYVFQKYRLFFDCLNNFFFWIICPAFFSGIVFFLYLTKKDILQTTLTLQQKIIVFHIIAGSILVGITSFYFWVRKLLKILKNWGFPNVIVMKEKLVDKMIQNGFTSLELLLVVSISLIITFATLPFIKTTIAIKNTNRIAQEFENVYNACCKMAKESASFTIDDLVNRGYLKTKTSFIGRNYSVSVSENGVVSIALSLPQKAVLLKEFPYPIKLYSFLGSRWVNAEYVIPKTDRTIADKNWYGF